MTYFILLLLAISISFNIFLVLIVEYLAEEEN
jgi:hypothetical protein